MPWWNPWKLLTLWALSCDFRPMVKLGEWICANLGQYLAHSWAPTVFIACSTVNVECWLANENDLLASLSIVGRGCNMAGEGSQATVLLGGALVHRWVMPSCLLHTSPTHAQRWSCRFGVTTVNENCCLLYQWTKDGAAMSYHIMLPWQGNWGWK